MGGIEIGLIIRIGIFLIIKDMIQMGNLFVPIRNSIKERDLCPNPHKLVDQVHLLEPLGIHQVVIY